MDDMEVEDKPKSPAREENNDDTASSPNRWTSSVKQCTEQCVAGQQVLHDLEKKRQKLDWNAMFVTDDLPSL